MPKRYHSSLQARRNAALKQRERRAAKRRLVWEDSPDGTPWTVHLDDPDRHRFTTRYDQKTKRWWIRDEASGIEQDGHSLEENQNWAQAQAMSYPDKVKQAGVHRKRKRKR